MRFNKPPLTIEEQVAKLRSRGLLIAEESAASWALRRLGYYRLAAYTLPFQNLSSPDKTFHPGTTLEQVLNLYTFDRALRLLVLDAIERVEVALRTSIVYHMSLADGAHWFTDASHFTPRFNHTTFLSEIEKELGLEPGHARPTKEHAEVFINHYYRKYGDPRLPPAWMIAETLSLGKMSRVYAGLRHPHHRQAIADAFGYNEAILGPWLHSLTYIRNICAHHSRLWNRQWVIKAQIPKKLSKQIPVSDRVYAALVVLADMLHTIDRPSHWRHRVRELIVAHPEADLTAMGIPADWKDHDMWKEPPLAQKTPPPVPAPNVPPDKL